ncbi:MAG: hypothetical protein ACTSQE_05580 [Candidatus Heimdallarchaeaceae archaeon]
MTTNIYKKKLIVTVFVLTTIISSCLNINITNSNKLNKGFALDPGTGDDGGSNGEPMPSVPYISYPDATDDTIKAEFIIIGMGYDELGQTCYGAWEDAILWCMWASALFELYDDNPSDYDTYSFEMNVHLFGPKDSVNQESLFDAPSSSRFRFDYHKGTLLNIYDTQLMLLRILIQTT